MQLIIRSVGYGIMIVEVAERSIPDEINMHHITNNMFPNLQEFVMDSDIRYSLVMLNDGHAPTKYEFNQLENEDWEWMRDLIDEKGSQLFSNRLSMLENDRHRV